MRAGDQAVIRPSGMNTASVPGLLSQMRALVAEGARLLVVDLADVQTVDASAIGLLISTHNSLHKLGGRLSVVHASKGILDLFHMMRVDQHFSITGDDVQE